MSSDYQPGDLTKLFNPTITADEIKSSVSSQNDAVVSKKEKKPKVVEKQPVSSSKTSIMKMSAAKAHALSVATSILRDKGNQTVLRESRIFESKPIKAKRHNSLLSDLHKKLENDDDEVNDGWSKNMEFSDFENDEDSLLGLVTATEAELRDHDVRVKEVDGDSEDEEKQARKAEKSKKKRYDPATDDRGSRTLFLGNVEINTTSKEIEKLCSPFGVIESVRFRSIAFSDPKLPKKVSFMKKQFHEARDSMTAYVVFATDAEAKAASAGLHNILFKEKHLRADIASSNAKADPYRSVFIGNVVFDANIEEVREFFAKCGEVEDVRLVTDKEIKIGKGFGFVTFVNKFSVEEALNLDGETFKGRALRITKVALAAKKSTGKFAVNAKRRLEERQERKDEKFSKQRSRDLMDVEAQPAKRVKLQGAYQKAMGDSGVGLKGADTKKPRHVPRQGAGKLGGVLNPEAWMGERAKIGDSLGRLAKPNSKKSNHNKRAKKAGK